MRWISNSLLPLSNVLIFVVYQCLHLLFLLSGVSTTSQSCTCAQINSRAAATRTNSCARAPCTGAPTCFCVVPTTPALVPQQPRTVVLLVVEDEIKDDSVQLMFYQGY
jgi:hypothetical protein